MDCGCCCCKVTVCANQSSFGSSDATALRFSLILMSSRGAKFMRDLLLRLSSQ